MCYRIQKETQTINRPKCNISLIELYTSDILPCPHRLVQLPCPKIEGSHSPLVNAKYRKEYVLTQYDHASIAISQMSCNDITESQLQGTLGGLVDLSNFIGQVVLIVPGICV